MIGDVWWLLWSYDSEGCVPLITSSIQLCSTSHDMYDRLPNWLAELPLVPKVLMKSCIGFWSLTRVCSACSKLLLLLWCTYVVHTSHPSQRRGKSFLEFRSFWLFEGKESRRVFPSSFKFGWCVRCWEGGYNFFIFEKDRSKISRFSYFDYIPNGFRISVWFFYEKVRILDKFVSVRAHATHFRLFVVAQTAEQADLLSTK